MNESLLSFSEVLESLSDIGGRRLNESFDVSSFCFKSVETDSRNVVSGTLFVPLVGERQDGHNFNQPAIDKGATVVFVSRDDELVETFIERNPKVAFIYSKNTMTALQRAAGFYVRKFPSLIRCSVTGSSGKTTTKEIAASILSQKYKVVANFGNYNSETGLPLSVFKIRGDHELGIFEMGMNRENEIGEIADVFRPNYGIVTNIGTAHIGILGSRENIAKEKKKIFSFLDENGVAVIPSGDDFASFLSEGVKGKVVLYGVDSNPRIKFISDDGLEGTLFSVDGVEIRLALPGRYNFLNALGAISLALEFGLTAEQIKRGVESVKLLGGRSELVKGKYTVLKDCYNANPDSMYKALELASSVKVPGKKIFVLGDMLELGADSEKEHKKIGDLLTKFDVDMVVLVGDEIKYALLGKNGGKPLFFVYVKGRGENAMAQAADAIKSHSSPGDFILLKGSRGVGLERILPLIGM